MKGILQSGFLVPISSEPAYTVHYKYLNMEVYKYEKSILQINKKCDQVKKSEKQHFFL